MSLKFIWNRVYWFFVRPPRTLYYFLFRPKSNSVKVLVKNADSFLLVRPTYSHRLWTIPGGALESGETFEQAARREIQEETGITLHSLEKIGEYQSTIHYKRDTIRCFLSITDQREIEIDGLEIAEAAWFRLDELPIDRTPRVDKLITMYRQIA